MESKWRFVLSLLTIYCLPLLHVYNHHIDAKGKWVLNGVPRRRYDVAMVLYDPTAHLVQDFARDIASKCVLNLSIACEAAPYIAPMVISDKEGVPDEVTPHGIGDELHGKIQHFKVIGLGSEVAVAVYKSIGPTLNLLQRGCLLRVFVWVFVGVEVYMPQPLTTPRERGFE